MVNVNRPEFDELHLAKEEPQPRPSNCPGRWMTERAYSASSGMWRRTCSSIVRRTHSWVAASAMR